MNTQFVVWLDNSGYEVSLEIRKLYQMLPDAEANKYHQIRIIDESGEDYLYLQQLFLELALPVHITEQLIRAA